LRFCVRKTSPRRHLTIGTVLCALGVSPICAETADPPVPFEAPPGTDPPDAAVPATAIRPQADALLSARLPVIVDGRRFGDVPVTATVTQVLTVSPTLLAAALAQALAPEARAALGALGEGQVPVATLAELGYVLRLDPQTLSLVVELRSELRIGQSFSLLYSDQFPGAKQVYPARFSAGFTGSLALTDNLDDGLGPATRLGFVGFANFGGLTGVNIDYGGTVELIDGELGFRRDAVTAFVDRPEQALRYAAGDLFPLLPVLSGAAPLLGVSIERSYQTLQPSRNIRPTGRRSFLLEQPGTVEVYANGILVNRFAAQPGPIDLADIPAANISNAISIVVEDAFGRRELDAFSLVNDVNLLDKGLDEFNASFGVLRDVSQVGFAYRREPVFAGSYSRGLTEQLTAGAHAAISGNLQNAGATAAFASLRGVMLAEVAVSRSSAGSEGLAASLSYRSGNFLPLTANDVLTARLEYFSADFATLTDPASFAADRVRAALDYRFEVSDTTSLQFGGTYADRHGQSGSDRFVTGGVNSRFGRLQASLNGRWGRDIFGREEAGGFITLSMIFGSRTIATGTYDSISDTARFELTRTRRLQAPDFSYRVGLQRNSQQQEGFAQGTYFHPRFEADARVIGDLANNGSSRGRSATFRLQSGIGFADGSFALGRDMGQGFYLVRRHPNLKDAGVTLYQGRSQTLPLASSGGFGPAVAPVTTAYQPTELLINVTDVPVGYDVGDTRFVILPGARSGVVIELGSEAYRWRLGTLLLEGEPVALVYGELINVKTGERQTFFTNATGRASFASLAPGDYDILLSDSAYGARFSVLDSDPAFIEMGTINLERAP